MWGVLSKLPEVPEPVGFFSGHWAFACAMGYPSIYCSFSATPRMLLAEQDLAQSGPGVVDINVGPEWGSWMRHLLFLFLPRRYSRRNSFPPGRPGLKDFPSSQWSWFPGLLPWYPACGWADERHSPGDQ